MFVKIKADIRHWLRELDKKYFFVILSFAAMGAQVPFSIRPTVRFWKLLVLRWVSRFSIGGKRKPS